MVCYNGLMLQFATTIASMMLSKNERLHRAVSNADPVLLAKLIEQGADPAYMPRSGMQYTGDSPVHIAVQNNDIDCLQVLISSGASLNSGGLERQPPLACWFNQQDRAMRNGGSLEDLPLAALEVGALLVEHGAVLGSGGRAMAMTGITPQGKIDADPQLKRLQAYLNGPFQADRAARALRDESPVVAGPRPARRF